MRENENAYMNDKPKTKNMSTLPSILSSGTQDFISNDGEAKPRESIVSVSGVTPLMHTLQAVEEEGALNKGSVAHNVLTDKNGASDLALNCGRKNSFKVSYQCYKN